MWLHLTRHSAKSALAVSFGFTLLCPPILLPRSLPQNTYPDTSRLERIVENIRRLHAPDLRVEVFQINLHKIGNQLIVSGEVVNPALPEMLLDSLQTAAGDLEIIDSITVLPSADLAPLVFGIVNISVANMRSSPSHTAELVNQPLMGTVMMLYKEESGFYYSRNWDRYLGWVSGAELVEVDSLLATAWQEGPRVVCTANYGLVRDRARSKGTVIADLIPGAVLKKAGQSGKWVRVETPDGRIGYVEKKLVTDEVTLKSTPSSHDRLISIARGYLGVPYLWGGTSAKGFDCSGFTQTVFRMNNISLPRDASQQARVGAPVDPGEHFENVLPGDLFLFGPSPERITHVGIYLGDDHFIHSSGSVHINSLDPTDELYNEYRDNMFRGVRRIPGD
ncbi:MAG: C40 family peptidase [Fidelibacterota bacterium]|nr:MAG: C40 family peptidase [Candidatus Neomarinimicrobiota bacterium]